MKQLLMKYAVAALLLTCIFAACRKNALQLSSDINANAEATKVTACQECDAKATANDLSATLQTYKFKDGANVVSSLADGTKIIAQVQSGRITQWVMETKSGKQLLPQSTEMTARMINRAGTGFHIYRICFYLDGLYNCWLVIKI